MRDDDVLEAFLRDAGIIPRAQLAQAKDAALERGVALWRYLAEEGLVSEDEARRALARATGIPFLQLDDAMLSDDTLRLIPEPFCREHELVAVAQRDGGLEVALLDPESLVALELLSLPFVLKPRLVDRASLTRALLRYQRILKAVFAADLDGLLFHAYGQGATAVHVEPRAEDVLVRYRVGGALYDALTLSQQKGDAIAAQLRQHARLFPDAHLPQEGRFTVALPRAGGGEERVVVRVHAVPGIAGQQLVAALSAGDRDAGLESLGLWGSALEDAHRTVARGRGLVLITGVAELRLALQRALLGAVSPARRAAFVGSRAAAPVGAIHFDTQEGTAAALRAALRHDQDVVALQDLGDAEAAALALAAAARGVLVLASVNAGNAADGVDALLALGLPLEALVEHTAASIAAREVPGLCAACRAPMRATRADLSPLEPHADFARVLAALKEARALDATLQWKDVMFYEPRGCARCVQGYKGSVLLSEILPYPLRAGSPGLSLPEDALAKAALGHISLAALREAAGETATRV